MSTVIDMSQLPPPAAVKTPAFQALKKQRLLELMALDPDFNGLLESDPAVKLIEILVYREMIAVATTNSAVLAVLLAYAKNEDLDQLGANFDVGRLIITPADDTTIPPTPANMENDDDFRRRIRLSWYARNTAGSIEAYEYFARSADGDVLDVKVYGPQEWAEVVPPGHVWVYVLSRIGDGTPSQSLLDKVYAALSPADTRPLTDYVFVKAPVIVPWEVDATLLIGEGPDPETIRQSALAATTQYAQSTHRIETRVSESGVHRAAKQPGVEDVDLRTPTASIIPAKGQAMYCTAINIDTQLLRTSGASERGGV
ncbi:baseplate J/gp47 family protein [Enterobacter bugandensis]|nr:baseplate J/gp47 family protein [Enterobacter bugandensis]